MQLTWIHIALFFTITCAADIEIPECEPPDQPRWGGYGPRQDFYLPGDTIHYYCDTDAHKNNTMFFIRKCLDTGDWSYGTPACVKGCEPPDQPRWGGYGPRQDFYLPGNEIQYYCDADTYIDGSFLKKCLETGVWSSDTPVCDPPTTFSSTTQSSTADDRGSSKNAVDGLRTTCTSTQAGERGEWSGNFTAPGELIRVMLFLPKGPVSYEVFLVKRNGEEVSCGSQTKCVEQYDWYITDCLGTNKMWYSTNKYVSGIKIKSLINSPLEICELIAHVLTSPTCKDPHYRIENGHLRVDRKLAVLMCDSGYTKSPDTTLKCVRDGVWNKKNLYCLKRQWEIDESDPASPDPENPNEPRRENPEPEKLEI